MSSFSVLKTQLRSATNFEKRPHCNHHVLGSTFSKVHQEVHQYLNDLNILENSPRRFKKHDWADHALAYAVSVLSQSGEQTKPRYQSKLLALSFWVTSVYLYDNLVDGTIMGAQQVEMSQRMFGLGWTETSKRFGDVWNNDAPHLVAFAEAIFNLAKKSADSFRAVQLPASCLEEILKLTHTHMEKRATEPDTSSLEGYVCWRADHSKFKYVAEVVAILREDVLYPSGLAADRALDMPKLPFLAQVSEPASKAAALLEDVLNYVRGAGNDANLVTLMAVGAWDKRRANSMMGLVLDEAGNPTAPKRLVSDQTDTAAGEGLSLIYKYVHEVEELLGACDATFPPIDTNIHDDEPMSDLPPEQMKTLAEAREAKIFDLAQKKQERDQHLAAAQVVVETLGGVFSHYFTFAHYKTAAMNLQSVLAAQSVVTHEGVGTRCAVTIRQGEFAPNLKSIVESNTQNMPPVVAKLVAKPTI